MKGIPNNVDSTLSSTSDGITPAYGRIGLALWNLRKGSQSEFLQTKRCTGKGPVGYCPILEELYKSRMEEKKYEYKTKS